MAPVIVKFSNLASISQRCGIYAIVNRASAKCYVGSALNMRRRLSGHIKALTSNSHYNLKLQNAWNKYGAEYFEMRCLEFISTQNKLLKREQHWIDCLDVIENGYNISPTAGSNFGAKWQQTNKREFLTLSHKENIAAAVRNVWKNRSLEEKLKILKPAHTSVRTFIVARKISKETRQKISEAMYGNQNARCKKSEQGRRNMCIAQQRRRKLEELI